MTEKDIDNMPNDEDLKPLPSDARDKAIDALKTLNNYETESSPFKPKQKAALKKVQDDVLAVLEKDGYDIRSAGIQLAVSLLVDNLSRQ
jgi:hypothetical protein